MINCRVLKISLLTEQSELGVNLYSLYVRPCLFSFFIFTENNTVFKSSVSGHADGNLFIGLK